MNIAIIVYSETGNTFSLCQKAQESLASLGHRVTLSRLTVRDVATDRSLRDKPSPNGYDVVLFGMPVQGFSVPDPVKSYFAGIDLPKGQKIGFLLTQFFKRDWLGGNQAIKQAKAILARFEPRCYAAAIVHVRSRRKDAQIAAALAQIANFEGNA